MIIIIIIAVRKSKRVHLRENVKQLFGQDDSCVIGRVDSCNREYGMTCRPTNRAALIPYNKPRMMAFTEERNVHGKGFVIGQLCAENDHVVGECLHRPRGRRQFVFESRDNDECYQMSRESVRQLGL